MRICVISAGASGLVAAKKLLDQGLAPTVFERNAGVGGNWLYGAPGSSKRDPPLPFLQDPPDPFRDRRVLVVGAGNSGLPRI